MSFERLNGCMPSHQAVASKHPSVLRATSQPDAGRRRTVCNLFLVRYAACKPVVFTTRRQWWRHFRCPMNNFRFMWYAEGRSLSAFLRLCFSAYSALAPVCWLCKYYYFQDYISVRSSRRGRTAVKLIFKLLDLFRVIIVNVYTSTLYDDTM